MDPPGVSNETVHGSDQGFILIRRATIVIKGPGYYQEQEQICITL